jgi:predicted porin
MLRRELACGAQGRVLLVDSITQLALGDAACVVVSGSHGGRSSGEVALRTAPRAVFFNDAGLGKDEAGIAALAMLQQRGIAAGAVAHHSARIGDAQDAWDHGVLSRLNDAALALGLQAGKPLQAAVRAWLE